MGYEEGYTNRDDEYNGPHEENLHPLVPRIRIDAEAYGNAVRLQMRDGHMSFNDAVHVVNVMRPDLIPGRR